MQLFVKVLMIFNVLIVRYSLNYEKLGELIDIWDKEPI